MSGISRRSFLVSAVAATTLSESSSPAQVPQGGRAPLRVQFTTGGRTVPLQMYAMFEDELFRDLDTMVLPHPNPFRGLNGGPGQPVPDVVVTCDWITGGWPEADRQSMLKYLDSGKGLVVLHHAVGTNNGEWPWFSENITGVMLCGIPVPRA